MSVNEDVTSVKLQLHLAVFEDVRFHPILNFGLFWAALLQMSVFCHPNFRQFWADPTFSAVRSTFLAEEEAQGRLAPRSGEQRGGIHFHPKTFSSTDTFIH